MLELKHIKKTYKSGNIETRALEDITVSFREREFVAILGPSGSGKTTCLNIIGGLDRYDSGEMIIRGKNTKNFKEKEWDAYRNNSVGFVFQNYNLISHISIVSNVELSMTLSGVPHRERRRRAIEVLEKVGLKDHLHKKPTQLSGGQMQRVAIARALVNDPEILLCDEPTGALDSATSVQIMELIKEIAKDRLVIMVTHNAKIAEQYADRIIQFQDGKIVSDTNPYLESASTDKFKLKKTSMSFFTALKLSFNNIMTKKARTFLTSLASSIGIIGIAVILSLSSGFQEEIDTFQREAMTEFPIIITQNTMQVSKENYREVNDFFNFGNRDYIDSDEVYLFDPEKSTILHKNKFTEEFMEYLNNIDPQICNSMGFTRLVKLNLIRKIGDKVIPVTISSGIQGRTSSSDMPTMSSRSNTGLSAYPIQINKEQGNYLENYYELLAGEYPKNERDLVLVVDSKNRVNVNVLTDLGFETEGIESIKFTDIVGTEFRLVSNNDYYIDTGLGTFLPGNDFEKMYNSENSITLKISGIVRQKPDNNLGLLSPGIAYSDELSQLVIEDAQNSEIVKAQMNVDYNIFTKKELNSEEKESFLSVLGGNPTPYMITIYPSSFEAKDAVIKYIDDYNEGKNEEEIIVYTDLAKTMTDLTSGIINAITIVLIAFSSISLVVSLIMIGIITYTSVLERTKEIGILRALGARKKDITRVFDAETCILGVFSGLLGIFIAFLCTFPINSIINRLTDYQVINVAQLKPIHAIILIIISTILTILGGHIPAKMASRKDAVEALRSE